MKRAADAVAGHTIRSARLTEEREDLLVKVASLYYEQDYSQQQIADMLPNMSRSNVSRLLKEAKARGLVEIRIHKRLPTVPALERDLVERFGIAHAMVFDGGSSSSEARLQAAGQLAAKYLENVLLPKDLLAISWGKGVSSAVTALSPNPTLGVEIVQMIGSIGRVYSVMDGPDLARQLATKLGGNYYYMQAPLFVDSPQARDLFLEQHSIAETLNLARRAKVALVGISTTDAAASSFLRAGHLTEEQLDTMRAQGIVGETAGQHFDMHGNADNLDINQRVIGVSLADLRRIPIVVAVACGLVKRRSILGALRGGFIKALATDDVTAAAVLEDEHLLRL
jgi:DNA-binding transcriptional regulator LsrR (DeoR family)